MLTSFLYCLDVLQEEEGEEAKEDGEPKEEAEGAGEGGSGGVKRSAHSERAGPPEACCHIHCKVARSVFLPEPLSFVKEAIYYHTLAKRSIKYRCLFSQESGSQRNTEHDHGHHVCLPQCRPGAADAHLTCPLCPPPFHIVKSLRAFLHARLQGQKSQTLVLQIPQVRSPAPESPCSCA